VADLVRELQGYGAKVDVVDPWASRVEAKHEYGITPIRNPRRAHYDAIVAAVGHEAFRKLGIEAVRRFGRKRHVIYDIKYVFPKDAVDGRL